MPRGGQSETFEFDAGPTRTVEQPNTITEQHRRDAHEDLVEHTRLEALLGDGGAENVDALVPSGGLRRLDTAGEVADEGDPGTGSSGGWWVSTN